MAGWTRRCLFLSTPFFLPAGISTAGANRPPGRIRIVLPLLCLLLTFILACFARLLELPFWDNTAYQLGEEYLLATHDAYHWIAGAEGFEFGAGHPMAVLARELSRMTGYAPAVVGFWLPPFMSGLLAVAVFLWAWGLGHPFAGLCAGVLASLTPAFCARTLLGFYDSDLVVLLFAVLLGLIPALWLSPWLASLPEVLSGGLLCRKIHGQSDGLQGEQKQPWYSKPPFSPLYFGRKAVSPGELSFRRGEMEASMLSWPWLILLVLSGIFGYSMQGWHSLFPYLVRYSALVPLAIIPLLGPRGGRKTLLAGFLCHAFPLLLGWPGAVAGLVYAAALILTRHDARDDYDPPAVPDKKRKDSQKALSLCWKLYPPCFDFQRFLARSTLTLCLLWGTVLLLALDTGVFTLMKQSFLSYVSRGGDMASSAVQGDPVIFPSVAQSIIEVQTISLRELFSYIYPLEFITIISLIIFACRLLVTPAFIWFVPLLALAFLSLRMGARMTLFGPPMLMLALCMEGGILLEAVLQAARRAIARRFALPACKADNGGAIFPALRLSASLGCTLLLAWPLLIYLPDYTQGPIISREQAEALTYLRKNSPKESLIWNWWDWGYATHHFAQRETIADGARHGGPSLYLPAAVYTTADPRFARQVIKYTATRGNVPGNVFAGRSARQAQQLMETLGNPSKPLIEAPGKQYIVVSLELLRLGLWVTRYGSWNFDRKTSAGSLMNNLSAGLTFNMDNGVILRSDGQPVYAASINIIENQGLESTTYNRYGAYHFIFSTQHIRYKTSPGSLGDYLKNVWKTLRPDHVFPTQLSDKLVMDEVFYNTMMVQLLLCPEDDPFIAPYFKLVFDNRYTRIFEVL